MYCSREVALSWFVAPLRYQNNITGIKKYLLLMWATPDLEVLATLSISDPWVMFPKVFPALHPALSMLRVCSPPAPHLLLSTALLGKPGTKAWRSLWSRCTRELTPSSSPHTFFTLQKQSKQAEFSDGQRQRKVGVVHGKCTLKKSFPKPRDPVAFPPA